MGGRRLPGLPSRNTLFLRGQKPMTQSQFVTALDLLPAQEHGMSIRMGSLRTPCPFMPRPVDEEGNVRGVDDVRHKLNGSSATDTHRHPGDRTHLPQ